MHPEQFVYVLAVIVAGVAAQWVGWRFRIPAIIVLLAVGLLLGPAFGVIHPSDDLGPFLEPVISLAVAIVVFEGGLSLNMRDLRGAGVGVRRLVLLGLPFNFALGTAAAYWVGGLPWPVAVLFGSILVVTGPTVILPLLRQVRLRHRPAALLKWEGVVNDPIGAILTIVILEFIVVTSWRGQEAELVTGLVVELGVASLVAVVLAVGAAHLVRWAFHHDQVSEVLKTPVLLAGALGLHAVGNAMHDEAGLIAATVFGLALANLEIRGLRALSQNKESLSVLLVSALFILLAADLDRGVLAMGSLQMVALVAVVLFLVRPVSIMLATWGSGLSWQERLLISWIGPRGIVAAAISGIVATRLQDNGFAGAELLLPAVFAVIAASVVIHGLTLGPLARWLDLRGTERPGLLIVGSSPWTVELARYLVALHVPVIMVDRSWTALRPAREADIPGLAVEVLSGWVEETLDTGTVDYVLAATDDDAYNALVCARFAPELGRERVLQLALHSNRLDPSRVPARDWRGKIIGEDRLDYATVNELLAEGWVFQVRRVKEDKPDVEDQRRDEAEKPLLAVHSNGRIVFSSPEQAAHANVGDCLIAFLPADMKERTEPGEECVEDEDLPDRTAASADDGARKRAT